MDYCHQHNLVDPAIAGRERNFGIRVTLPANDTLRNVLGNDWERLHWYLGDERCYPPGHAGRNDVMLEAELWSRIDTPAANRHPIPAELGPEAAAERYSGEIVSAGQLDIVLLGMGEDGHFASLFPDFEQLPSALDPAARDSCIVVQTASSPHLRISLTLAALLNAEHIVLLMFGDDQRAVYEQAIDERTRQYRQLKEAVAGILYMRNKLEAEITADSLDLKKAESFKIWAQTENLQLGSLPGVREGVGLPVSGGLNAELELTLPKMKFKEAEGFFNRNPLDTKRHAGGVWALPPSLRGHETDAEKARYREIGESERMTLVFRKP